MDAETHLSDYLRKRPLPVYPWLRQIAWQRLVDLHHHHLNRQKRSVRRERDGLLDLPDASAHRLADHFVDNRTGPSARLMRDELRARVRAALDRLESQDREILVLRHLEQMPVKEIASLLDISASAVKMRRLRAIQRLQAALGHDQWES
jgi:RNA polymerase sigma-70 factor (ECF subfamily)